MNYIDLFAGAGGLSEGFAQAGFTSVAHVEMDADACNTLRTRLAREYLLGRRFDRVYDDYLRGDITREKLYGMVPSSLMESVINEAISPETLPDIFARIHRQLPEGQTVDLIVGGPPCQTFSVAGRARKGREAMENDPRSRLYVQYAAFLEEFRPRMFVFENVLGLLSFRQSSQLNTIRDTFYKAGYHMDVRQWNARVFGVLQSRERLILIGWRREETALGYPDIRTSFPHKFRVQDVLQDLPKLQPGGKSHRYKGDPSPYLSQFKIREKKDVLTWHEARPNRPLDLEIYAKAIEVWNKEGRQIRYPDDLEAHQIQHKNVTGFADRFKVVPGNKEYSQTIVAHIHKDGHYYIHPDATQCRSLSVREAARLQSFPDNFYFEGPRTSAYKQIGNAVPPLMARCIADSVHRALKGSGKFLPMSELLLEYSDEPELQPEAVS